MNNLYTRLMEKFKRALITGASKGLGYEITLALAPRCQNLVLAARDAAALESLKQLLIQNGFKGEIEIIIVDLTKMDAVNKFQSLADVDLLINNAGLGILNHFEKSNQDEINQMIMVNSYNLTMLTQHFSKKMLERGEGQIINVSSIAGFIVSPIFSVYAATKAYVTHLSTSLDFEFRDRGVRVKAICPGGIKTNFHHVAGAKDEIMSENAFFVETPQQIARDVLHLIDSDANIYIPRLYNKLFRFLSSLAPKFLVAKQTKRLYQKFLINKS